MNDHDIAQLTELSTLAGASVQRALKARQEITPLSAEQTELVGGGRLTMPTMLTGPSLLYFRPPIWQGIWQPRPHLNNRY